MVALFGKRYGVPDPTMKELPDQNYGAEELSTRPFRSLDGGISLLCGTKKIVNDQIFH